MPTDTRVFEFLDFRIDIGERVLYQRGVPVRLAPKVFDTLLALVSRSGRVVSKDTLMEEVWQNTFVEENNLTQHIFTLRRTLGENKNGTKFIETVSRRGYRFVPHVKVIDSGEFTAGQVSSDTSDSVEGAPAIPHLEGIQRTDLANTSPIARRPVGFAILILGAAVAVLIVSLGFVLRSDRHPASSRQVNLLRLSESGTLWGASISPDGKSLAYVVREGTAHSLRLKNIQTESELVIVPPADVPLGNPRFSPDGNFIYLARKNEVFRIPIFGGEWLKIASNLWNNFSVSPDGSQIAFSRDTTPGGSSSMVVADTAGGGDRVVATKTAPDFYVGWGPAPAFSTDGKHLTAVTGKRNGDHVEIVEIDTESGEERDLKMDAVWEAVEYVDWRSSSELLVSGKKKGEDSTQIWGVKFPRGSVEHVTNDFNNYLSFTLSSDKNSIVAIQESENLHLWRFDAETGAAQQITSGISRSEGRYGLAFAPDGQILFTARDRNNYDIFSVDSSGGDVRQLTRNAGQNLDAVVSPDGQFIAFVSDRTGLRRLWLMNRDGSGARQLTEAGNDKEIAENAPFFSADGLWIYYVSQQSGKSAIYKVSIDGGEPQPVGKGDEGADKPVPSPDGRLLAHAAYNAGATSPWQVAIQPLDDEGGTERFFDFPAFRSRVRWTPDSGSIVSVDDRTGGYNLWRTNLRTGERQPITSFKSDKIYRFDVSPDGRSYVLARGDYFYNAVLIEP